MSNFTIIGRRWFERVNGNTYHSVEVYENGVLLERDPFTYGYDRQYEQTAMEILRKHHPRLMQAADKKAGHKIWNGWSLESNSRHTVTVSVTDVQRKKDL